MLIHEITVRVHAPDEWDNKKIEQAVLEIENCGLTVEIEDKADESLNWLAAHDSESLLGECYLTVEE